MPERLELIARFDDLYARMCAARNQMTPEQRHTLMSKFFRALIANGINPARYY